MKKYIIAFLILIMSVFTLSGCKEENRERLLYISSDDTALLSLFSDDGSSESNFFLQNYGHAFISVTNTSTSAFMVGDRNVEPNETITVGLWNVFQHSGIWYNLESNYIKEHNKYNKRVSITIGIDNNDINTISSLIKEKDRWTPLYNCSKFALDAWNLVAEQSEKINAKFIMSPSYLVNEICKFQEHEKVKELVTDENIRFYKEV